MPEPYRPVSYLEANAGRRPHASAVWDRRDISFDELLTGVRAYRRGLAARGVRPGDVVGVRLPNVWHYVALELALPDIGAVILPLPLGLGEHEMRQAIEKTRARLVIDEELVLDSTGDEPPRAGADPDRIVEIAMTSGTTGLPKLASLSARLKQVTFEAFTGRLSINEDDRVLPMTPLTQGIGGMCLYCLRRGAALVMLREPHWTPEHCLDVARRSRATVLVGVPTNVIRMLHHSISLPDARAVANVSRSSSPCAEIARGESRCRAQRTGGHRPCLAGNEPAWSVNPAMIWFWLGFFALVGVLLYLDLGVLHKDAKEPTLRSAAWWTAAWMALGLAFGGVVYLIYANGWLGGPRPVICYGCNKRSQRTRRTWGKVRIKAMAHVLNEVL